MLQEANVKAIAQYSLAKVDEPETAKTLVNATDDIVSDTESSDSDSDAPVVTTLLDEIKCMFWSIVSEM